MGVAWRIDLGPTTSEAEPRMIEYVDGVGLANLRLFDQSQGIPVPVILWQVITVISPSVELRGFNWGDTRSSNSPLVDQGIPIVQDHLHLSSVAQEDSSNTVAEDQLNRNQTQGNCWGAEEERESEVG